MANRPWDHNTDDFWTTVITMIGLFLLGCLAGIIIGGNIEKYKIRELHKEIGIQIVKTEIEDKITYSYVTLDSTSKNTK